MNEWSSAKSKEELKKLYLSLLPIIKNVARKSGYAIGIHGSLERDLDLIAVPWKRKCISPRLLANKIQKACCDTYEANPKAFMKPHGRTGYVLHIGTYAYIDLSVMSTEQFWVKSLSL